MVILGHEEKTAYEISRTHTLCALDHAETSGITHLLISIGTISSGGGVISVDSKVAVELVKQLQRGIVRSVKHNLVHPLARVDGGEALLVVHHGRSLVSLDLLIGVNSDHEDVAQHLGLANGVIVTTMHDVEASIDVSTSQLSFLLLGVGVVLFFDLVLDNIWRRGTARKRAGRETIVS